MRKTRCPAAMGGEAIAAVDEEKTKQSYLSEKDFHSFSQIYLELTEDSSYSVPDWGNRIQPAEVNSICCEIYVACCLDLCLLLYLKNCVSQ